MSLYDHLYISAEVLGEAARTEEDIYLQTKSLDCKLSEFTISSIGILCKKWKDDYDSSVFYMHFNHHGSILCYRYLDDKVIDYELLFNRGRLYAVRNLTDDLAYPWPIK